ncbi:hypothetical protein VP01_161g7, partial [Puccinia sorghi]
MTGEMSVGFEPVYSKATKEVDKAYTQIHSYWFIHSGINVIWDPLNEDSIISIIKFTPFDKLTPSEKDDLNFISTFLQNSKFFISPFSANLMTRTKFLDGTSSSLGLETRLLSIRIIEIPLGLVRLLSHNLMKNITCLPSLIFVMVKFLKTQLALLISHSPPR